MRLPEKDISFLKKTYLLVITFMKNDTN